MKKSRVKKPSTMSRKLVVTLGLGTAIVGSAAAVAATISLVHARLNMPETQIASWLVPPLMASDPGSGEPAGGLPSGVGSTTTKSTPPPTPVRKATVGTNLDVAAYYSTNRIFANLASNQGWTVTPVGGGSTDSYFDADRNVIKVNPGDRVTRFLQVPTDYYRGKSVDIICRWDGEGVIAPLIIDQVKNWAVRGKAIRYTFVPTPGSHPYFLIALESVNPSDPLRNLDCREANVKRDALFDATYLANVSRYSTLRYMGWQHTNDNYYLTWAKRTTANSQVRGDDGYAIEHMIALSNQTKTNPWFCMSWNADDDYIRRFAELVRDTLDPNLVVYVELSNEVWNWVYPQTVQARDEGKAAGLSTDDGQAMLRRYAQKTIHVMDIWRDVFAGQEHRLVRVAASQAANPWTIRQVVGFQDTPAHIDAISSAPYFEANLDTWTGSKTDLTALFAALKQNIDVRIGNAVEYTQIAKQHGLRYIAYEGGQHVIGNDAALNFRVQNDPRMGQLYTYYLSRWNNEVGDLMALLQDVGKTGAHGGWGALENIGQAPGSTPKSRAIDLFIASIGRR